jgi:putative ABC transport system ATP-binding protein
VSLSVQLTNVVRQYRAGGQLVRALDGLNLQIYGGEFTAIVGPSGAGKSTLLHLLGALDSPDSGSIRFDGAEIAAMTDDQQSTFRRHKVGFIFQFFNLLPTLTAWENVAVPMLLDGHKLKHVRQDAFQLLRLVGLGNRLEHRPAELSGGQMQRVAVARALMMDPPLILADEPTGNLDSATGAAILELLHNVAHDVGDERAVVMVTHNLEAAAETDRVVTLHDGAVTADVLTGEAPSTGRHARRPYAEAVTDVIKDLASELAAPDYKRVGSHRLNRL